LIIDNWGEKKPRHSSNQPRLREKFEQSTVEKVGRAGGALRAREVNRRAVEQVRRKLKIAEGRQF
jgi:hypothetical protein